MRPAEKGSPAGSVSAVGTFCPEAGEVGAQLYRSREVEVVIRFCRQQVENAWPRKKPFELICCGSATGGDVN